MEVFVIALYTAIVGGTLVAQFHPVFQNSNKFDFLLFINVFKLFSPKPVNIDVRIFYRDLYDDKSISELIEFDYYARPSLSKSLWYFGRKEYYLISRCLRVISQMNRNHMGDEAIFRSRFFKKIQFEVLKLNRHDQIVSRQIVFISHKSFIDDKNSSIYLIKNIRLKR